MSVNDDLFDAGNRHQVYLLRFGGGATKRVLALLEEAEKDLVSRLATRASKLTAIQTKRYKALIQAIRAQSRDVSIAMQKTLEKDLKGLAYQEFDIADRNLTRAVGVDLNNFRPPPDVVNSLVTKQAVRQRTLRSWFKQLEDDRARRLESAVGLGLVEGDTLPQMVRRFRDSERITRRQAETLVRTHVNHVGNHAKRAFYEANSDIIKSVRWTSTLDGRTSSICQARDGKTYSLGGGPTPPAHPNCRSVLVPVTKSWSELAGKKLKPGRGAKEMRGLFEKNLAAQGFGPDEIKRIQANTRASMNGQVPEGMTYQKWLQRQPQAFQDDVLGPTKGQLFRQGNLPLTKFVDGTRARNLTLDEIRRKNEDVWQTVFPPATSAPRHAEETVMEWYERNSSPRQYESYKAKAMAQTNEFAQLHVQETASIIEYTSNSFTVLNGALRSKTAEQIAEHKVIIESAVDGLKKLPPFEGTSYRGTRLPLDMRNRLQVGDTFEDEAFLSTSSDARAAFDGNTTFTIQGKTGRSVESISEFSGEKEILFMPGTKFRITKIEDRMRGDVIEKRHIFMSEI